MKNLKYLVVFSSLIIVSCDSDMLDRMDDMAGTWQLTEMTYTDPQGTTKTVSDSETTLTFTKEIAGGGDENVDGVRYGVQDIGEETFRYQYSVNFPQGRINILFEEGNVRREDRLPLDAIGRLQVYDFEQIDKSRIVISTPKEFNQDKADSDIFTDVRYVLKRQ